MNIESVNKLMIVVIMIMSVFVLSGQTYQQDKSLLGSGAAAEGGQYKFNGSVGQISVETSSGGQFVVQAGFWQKNLDLIFEDEFE